MNEFDKTKLPINGSIAWWYESDLEQSWLDQVPDSIQSISEKRTREFAASRKALAVATNLSQMDQLTIIDYLYLQGKPETKVSLSHTRGLSAAFAATGVSSVGVDIEHLDRRFNEATQKFYRTEEDLIIDPLKLWVMKEAAFKALSPLGAIYRDHKDVLVLKDISVKDQVFYFQSQKIGHVHVQEHNGLLTGYAWID